MIALLQRVRKASVTVDDDCIGRIDQGILALIGVQPDDDDVLLRHFVSRILNYRMFSDVEGKMNLSLVDSQGGLLLVPQFTLAANTRKGRRPSFTSAATPKHGEEVFHAMFNVARSIYATVECGQFGADMQVELINDGPVTFILD
ncbi:MAG: D-tyrosyl-tRNA(Tyr) deacylase [Gammaproteobacteria bacterium]